MTRKDFFDGDSGEFREDFSTSGDGLLSSLDGSVQAQGIRVGHRDWLDMGSPGWQETEDNVKAAAYQAAHVTGWEDCRLQEIMQSCYCHITDHLMVTTIECLKELAEQYPLHVEELRDQELDIKLKTGLDNDDFTEAEAK